MVQTCLEIFAAGWRESRAWTRWCTLVWLLVAVGCSTTPPQPVAAQLVVINVTDYTWHLAIAPVTGGEARSERVPPRSERIIEVTGGAYEIEQTVVSAVGSPDLSRRISCRLESGQIYRWQLATLLSGSPAFLP